ncbi:MAG: transcriptional regulator [Planctomycetota bacterium]
MKPVKRIEIVIGAAHARGLTDALKRAGVPGYTLIRDVQGTGDRGDRGGDELTDVYRNCYLIVAAPEDVVPPLLEAVRPMLDRYGGMCLVSDGQLLRD